MQNDSSEIYFKEINKIENVSRETFSKLEIFTELLLKWNKSINLVSKSHLSPQNIWQRHIIDSAQLASYIPGDARLITDFGSGAGFPGVILAIIGKWDIHLIESDQRKCAFLTEATTLLDIDIRIYNDRIENLGAWGSDVLTARALAPLNKIFDVTEKFIEKSKLCLFLKGQNVVEEIDKASKYWNIEYDIQPSITGNGGNILLVNNTSRK